MCVEGYVADLLRSCFVADVVVLLGHCCGLWDGGEVAKFLWWVLLLFFLLVGRLILVCMVGFVADLLR